MTASRFIAQPVTTKPQNDLAGDSALIRSPQIYGATLSTVLGDGWTIREIAAPPQKGERSVKLGKESCVAYNHVKQEIFLAL